ncbi:hypothetical protein [Bartonella sp. MM73XJBT.G]|nr:hypothetical protein [Bartonella sp. MM73XJBT.G]
MGVISLGLEVFRRVLLYNKTVKRRSLMVGIIKIEGIRVWGQD